jgi:divalent anion:Na+ symporter, DASS family
MLAGSPVLPQTPRPRIAASPAPLRTAVRASAAPPAAPADAGWPGAKLKPMAIAVGVGLALRFLVPIPMGVTEQAWSTLAIFISTILGLVLEPLPVGAWAFCGLTTAVFTKTLTFQAAFSAFTNEVIWLIVCSFFFAKGFEKTGLGQRVANLFVRAVGKSTLGLAYGLTVAEALISPAMPSTSARAGGIFVPIIKSLSEASGSMPNDPSRTKLGAFLIASQLHSSNHTSALFLTAAAQNLLCLNLAAAIGVNVGNAFVTWFTAACVPALVGTLLMPFLTYKLLDPELKDTPEAPQRAAERLAAMGPMSRDERIMLSVMGLAVVLWVTGDKIGVSAVQAAMLGLSCLLVTGVLKWRDCLEYTPAWDTLTWFAVLIGMSSQLNQMGLISTFAGQMGAAITSLNLGWPAVAVALNVIYYFLHYLFASQTAHVGALFTAFTAMMVASGVPPVLAALSLALNTNLFGAITHYASGQAAVYYGAGFLQLPEVFRLGAVLTAVNLAVWIVLGGVWWKVIGLY